MAASGGRGVVGSGAHLAAATLAHWDPAGRGLGTRGLTRLLGGSRPPGMQAELQAGNGVPIKASLTADLPLKKRRL